MKQLCLMLLVFLVTPVVRMTEGNLPVNAGPVRAMVELTASVTPDKALRPEVFKKISCE